MPFAVVGADEEGEGDNQPKSKKRPKRTYPCLHSFLGTAPLLEKRPSIAYPRPPQRTHQRTSTSIKEITQLRESKDPDDEETQICRQGRGLSSTSGTGHRRRKLKTLNPQRILEYTRSALLKREPYLYQSTSDSQPSMYQDKELTPAIIFSSAHLLSVTQEANILTPVDLHRRHAQSKDTDSG